DKWRRVAALQSRHPSLWLTVKVPASAVLKRWDGPGAGRARPQAEDAAGSRLGRESAVLRHPGGDNALSGLWIGLQIVDAALENEHVVAALQVHGCRGVRREVASPARGRQTVEVERAVDPDAPNRRRVRSTIGTHGGEPIVAGAFQPPLGAGPWQRGA